MPPRFSGLGVRVVVLAEVGPCELVAVGAAGDRRAAFVGGEVTCFGISLLELFLEKYDGLFGSVRVGRVGTGLAID